MKTKIDKIKKVTERNINKIAVFFETSLGFPHEIFFDKINKMKGLIEPMHFVFSFYEKHKKWSEKNGVIVQYNQMIS